MNKKLSPENIGEIAASNPFLDLRQIEEWRVINEEMKRLGIDLSRPVPPPAPSKAAPPRHIQRVSPKRF